MEIHLDPDQGRRIRVSEIPTTPISGLSFPGTKLLPRRVPETPVASQQRRRSVTIMRTRFPSYSRSRITAPASSAASTSPSDWGSETAVRGIGSCTALHPAAPSAFESGVLYCGDRDGFPRASRQRCAFLFRSAGRPCSEPPSRGLLSTSSSPRTSRLQLCAHRASGWTRRAHAREPRLSALLPASREMR